MSVIEIKDLSFAYAGTEDKVLNNINLKVEKGDFLAVLGNNGSGKSTLCKAINGLIPHFLNGKYYGQVLVNGINTLESDVGLLAKEVAYVYQDFENQIVRPLVIDDASYACLNYGYKEYLQMGERALKACGLEDKISSYIWELSGGQTHLLALASAIALGPDIIILDEPIAQLDPGNADKVYEILKKLNGELGKTIITIEHHTEYIAQYCSHAILLNNGSIMWHLPAKEALNKVEDLQNSYIYPPQVTQAAYRYSKDKDIEYKGLLPINISEGKEFFKDFTYLGGRDHSNKNAQEKKEIVKFQNVSVAYDQIKGQANQVFNNLNLSIKKGDKIALIGSNGAGKSTLLKLIIGLVNPDEGEILLDNLNIRDLSPEYLSNKVSLVYQNPEEMFIMDSIEEDIGYAMKVRNIEDYEEKTQSLLDRFRLIPLKDRDGRLMSGGQMRRASLAIGIALSPKLLMLDEPTANLDIATRTELTKLLDDIKDHTETVLIATHDMQLVSEWAERIIVLHKGKVVADGSRDEIFGNKDILDIVGIRPPEIFNLGKALDDKAYTYTVNEFLQGFKYE